MIKGMVSCIIPTYKRSDMLVRAIKSVLSQSYTNLEVLVVDDNNPGDEYSCQVHKVVSAISDNRLTIVTQERHINGAAARNAGIQAASGEYIAFLDDDDEWLPLKLEKQIEALSKQPECDGASCLYKKVKENNTIYSCPIYSCDNLHQKVFERTVSVCTPTLLIKKSCFSTNKWFNESLNRHQELQVLLDFLRNNKLVLVKEMLVIIHVDSAINRPNSEQIIQVKESFFQSVKEHLQIYTAKDQGRIYAAHFFEIVYVAIKERKYRLAWKYIKKIGWTPKAYWLVVKRFLCRIIYK